MYKVRQQIRSSGGTERDQAVVDGKLKPVYSWISGSELWRNKRKLKTGLFVVSYRQWGVSVSVLIRTILVDLLKRHS